MGTDLVPFAVCPALRPACFLISLAIPVLSDVSFPHVFVRVDGVSLSYLCLVAGCLHRQPGLFSPPLAFCSGNIVTEVHQFVDV